MARKIFKGIGKIAGGIIGTGGGKKKAAAPEGPVVTDLSAGAPGLSRKRRGSGTLAEGYRGYQGNTILSDTLGG